MFLKTFALIRNRSTVLGPRRTSWEIAKIVGAISLVFGLIAGLLIWLSDAASARDHAPRSADERAAPSVVNRAPTEIYLGAFYSANASPALAKQREDAEGVRIIEFELSGVMRGTIDEVVNLERKLERYQVRLQDAIMQITRGATDEELAEPSMDALRAKIRTKLNNLLGPKVFEEVVFDHFRVYDI